MGMYGKGGGSTREACVFGSWDDEDDEEEEGEGDGCAAVICNRAKSSSGFQWRVLARTTRPDEKSRYHCLDWVCWRVSSWADSAMQWEQVSKRPLVLVVGREMDRAVPFVW